MAADSNVTNDQVSHQQQTQQVLVWDLPVRLFHWALFALVTAAVVTVRIGGEAMAWHGHIGRLILALLAFRVVWGFVGTRYARFSDFWHGPMALFDYVRGRWRGLGHNPLGAWSVFALLLLLILMAASGLFANDDAAYRGPLFRAISNGVSDNLSIWHRRGEWLVYGLVGLHILAVLFYSLVRKRPLIQSMITGRQILRRPATIADAETTTPDQRRGGGPIALISALLIALAVWWFSGGSWIPEPPPPPPPAFDW